MNNLIFENRSISFLGRHGRLGNTSSGFIVVEIIIALLVLGFIVHPVFVEGHDHHGRRTTIVEWEFPMNEVLAQMGDIGGLIDRSWEGLDRKFGYTGPKMGDQAVRLMSSSLQNGVVLMTAGFVNKQGRVTTRFQDNAANFEDAAKGFVLACYNAAQEGMSR